MSEQQTTKSRRGGMLLSGSNPQAEQGTPPTVAEIPTPLPEPAPSQLQSPEPERRATVDHGMGLQGKKTRFEAMNAAHRHSFSGASSFRRGSTIAPKSTLLAPELKQRRYSVVRSKSISKQINNASAETLTQQQVLAFKEAFDLFDKNGGGTIDAQELQKTLESVGIYLEEEEIHDVMMRLDKDGNGEIDFEEFLNLMTNTEMFLEAFASRHGTNSKKDIRRERDVLLFDALTEFMKKSALKDAHEIVGYYAKTYKKVVKSYNKNKGAHVVGHYADGARLIGLTEKQLEMQLKQLTLNQNYGDEGASCSPYAQPLHLSMLRSVMTSGRKFRKKYRKRKKKDEKRPASLDAGGTNAASEASEETPSRYSEPLQQHRSATSTFSDFSTQAAQAMRRHTSVPHRGSGKIILKVIMNRDSKGKDDAGAKPGDRGEASKRWESSKKHEESHKDKVIEHKPGWLSQRNIMYNVDISLPIQYRHVQVDRLPRLRKKVEEAKTKFIEGIAEKKIQHNIRHYKELDSRRIPSPQLNKRFLKVFSAYSCAETNNKTAVTVKQLRKIAKLNCYAKKQPTPFNKANPVTKPVR